MDIPIVVAAYDREIALDRLLGSLQRAHYAEPVKLIISIDGGGREDVVKIADRFAWGHGEKEIIVHEHKLGLRNHILYCGGLSVQYDGILLLEDDLYVSPWFYQFAKHAALFYYDSNEICGIALYSPHFNECAFLPFCPLDDGRDVYFMQLACSWGQLWLQRQWKEFSAWYEENKYLELEEDPSLPLVIRQWPVTSWKKYFIKFMVEKDKYFLYPRHSYTTNFGDVGTHHAGTLLFQTPIVLGEKLFNFVNFTKSFVKYDSYGEILQKSLHDYCPFLSSYDFTVDIYGIKQTESIDTKYILTTKKCNNSIKSYGKYMKPQEINVIENIYGNDIFLAEVDSICEHGQNNFLTHITSKSSSVEEHKYYYQIPDFYYSKLNKTINEYKLSLANADKNILDHKKQNSELKGIIERERATRREILGFLADAQKDIELVRNSKSYKIGNTIVRPFSLLRKKLKA